MRKRWKIASVFFALVGIFCMFGSSGVLSAQESARSSSECIKCHTNLRLMDSYGEKTAAASAATIAG